MASQNEQLDPLLHQGMALIGAGRLDEARTHYTRVTRLYPDSADAWYMLSNINGRLGDIEQAGVCARRSIDLHPDFTEAHLNLGNVLLHQGRHDEALAQYQKVLSLDPRHLGAHLNSAHLLSAVGHHNEAAKNYKIALDIDTSGAILTALKQQGAALLQDNRLEEAKVHLELACQRAPEDVDAQHSLSIVHGRLGNLDAAEECSRRVLALQPDHCKAHISLGHARFRKGRLDEACILYLKALEIDSQSISALNNLGRACQSRDQFEKYIAAYRNAVAVMPDPTMARMAFIETMEGKTPVTHEAWLEEELLKCFSITGIDYKPLSLTTARTLRHKYHIHDEAQYDNTRLDVLIEQISGDELFKTFLEKTINIDSQLEFILTRVRRRLLERYRHDGSLDDKALSVVTALAYHCFNNEHVFPVNEEEEAHVAELKRDLERRTAAAESVGALETALLVYSLYEPMNALSCDTGLCQPPLSNWSEDIRPLIKETLHHPAEESRIKRDIPTLCAIQDGTSRLVQSQYEENPYPRWLEIPEVQKISLRQVLKHQFPHFSPPGFLDGPIQILVAGCGTGKQPIQTALAYKDDNIQILAVDISKSSLAYAMRMARKYGVTNIRFMQGDILELERLDRRFHIIECRGVLHHMEDPVAGWKVLSGLLVEGGLMSLGLYSQTARRELTGVRDRFKEMKSAPDKRYIREFRNKILRGEMGDYNIRSYDFYSTSGCRDLVFHYVEHEYTPMKLAKIMGDLNLDFLGFTFREAGIKSNYRRLFPQDDTLTDLALWEEFEAMYPHTFDKMYQFWCQKGRPSVTETSATKTG